MSAAHAARPFQSGCPSLLRMDMVVEMNVGGGMGGVGEKSVPETPREMVAVNTRLFLMIEGWEKGEICM